MKRTPFKRKPPKPRDPNRKRSAYATRERDWAFMGAVKALTCAVTWEMIPITWSVRPADWLCLGPIEADHMGSRGLSRKAIDGTCAPLCQGHHRERTDHSGLFRDATKEELRTWRAAVIEETQRLLNVSG